MYPVLFKIGPLDIHAYGFMLAVAFLVGILITLRFARKEGIKEETVLELAVYAIIAALAGSRILYVIGQWDQYRENILEIFMVQKGGLAFLGGLLLAIAVVALALKRKGIPFLKFMDVSAPGVSLGYAIARIGCFLNGCCFGLPTGVPWGMRFPLGALAHSHFPGERIHPTQLYALFSMLIVFWIVVRLWKRRKYDGYVFFWWLVLYGVYRFGVEFFRFCPPNLYWLGLNPGQIIALFMFAVGAVNLFRRRSSVPGA
jgi:phosphatidylglycerol:prolipoprotein diacylglycerol transferase